MKLIFPKNWNHENYLGFGPSAHSFWWDDGKQSAKRWNNNRDFRAYIQSDWQSENDLETLNLHQLAEERIMLGLRMKKGITLSELEKVYQYNLSDKQLEYLSRIKKQGTINLEEDQLTLTEKGLLIADLIVLDLITV